MKSVFEIAVALGAAAWLAACHTAPDHENPGKRPFYCANCHTPEFTSTKHPPHAGVRPGTCGVCHTQQSWHGARIDHPWWELTGAHARAAADKQLAGTEQRVKCFWCHRGEPAQFSGTPRDCIGCHAEDRVGVKFPGHDGFSERCETCHSTDAWKPAAHPELPVSTPPVASAAVPKHPTPVPKAHPVVAPPRPPTLSPTPTSVPTTATPTLPRPPAVPTPDVVTHASRHH